MLTAARLTLAMPSTYSRAMPTVPQAEKLSEMLVAEKLGAIDSVIEFKIPDEAGPPYPPHLVSFAWLRFAELSLA